MYLHYKNMHFTLVLTITFLWNIYRLKPYRFHLSMNFGLVWLVWLFSCTGRPGWIVKHGKAIRGSQTEDAGRASQWYIPPQGWGSGEKEGAGGLHLYGWCTLKHANGMLIGDHSYTVFIYWCQTDDIGCSLNQVFLLMMEVQYFVQ